MDEAGRRQRRSKKEVLQEVQQAQGSGQAGDAAPAAATPGGADPSSRLFAFDDGSGDVELADMAAVSASDFVFPADLAAAATAAAAATEAPSSSSASESAPAGLSKFQLQMSGQWNRQVMAYTWVSPRSSPSPTRPIPVR